MPRMTLVVLSWVALAGAAHAGGEGPPGAAPSMQAAAVPPDEPVETRWYGWQILAVDVASIAVLAAGEDDALFSSIGAGGWVLGGPAVHLVHGHGGRAVGSLALRLAAPIAGAMIASAACPGDENDEVFGCLDNIAIGLVAGAGAAMVIDIVLATEEVESPPPVAPVLMVTDAGAQVGLAGRF